MLFIKERILQILFVPTLFWAVVIIFSNEITSLLQSFSGLEGDMLHNLKETLIFILIFLSTLFICRIVYYFLPSFLLLSKSSSLLSIILRLLAYTPLIFSMLAFAIFCMWWVFVVSNEDPTHSQYGLSAWFAAFFYGIALTPLFTVIAVWFFSLDHIDEKTL